MFKETFYHGHLRKYTVLFGTLFNNIYINRVDSDNDQISTIKVPISYSPKDKMIARVDADPELNKPVAIVLPRMGFEITSLNYAPERKLATTKRFNIKQHANIPDNLKYIYNPVPYDINFSLYIAVKNTEDGTRILEQILPYFTPDWTTTINLIPELDIKLDIPLVMINVTSEDMYDGNYIERRVLVWSLDFQMKGYLFGPIKKSGVITLATTNFFTDEKDVANVAAETITIKPGLTANGQPTTNASNSLERSEISSNSNYDYIVTYEVNNGQ